MFTRTVDPCPVTTPAAVCVHDLAIALARGHIESREGAITLETRAVAGEAVQELQRLFEASGQDWPSFARQARDEGAFELYRQCAKRGPVDERTIAMMVDWALTMVWLVVQGQGDEGVEAFKKRARDHWQIVVGAATVSLDSVH